VHKADNLTTILCPKSGKLNFLEPSGPLQACNGTDLPLPVALRNKNEMLLVMEMQRVSSVLGTGVLNIVQINYGFKKSMYIQRCLQKC